MLCPSFLGEETLLFVRKVFFLGIIPKKVYTSCASNLKVDSFDMFPRNGIYPLTAFAPLTNLTNNRPRAVSPELAESVKSDTPEPLDTEPRMVINMTCQVTKPTEVEEYACPQVRCDGV